MKTKTYDLHPDQPDFPERMDRIECRERHERATLAGKGDQRRPTRWRAYHAGWERVFGGGRNGR